MNSNSTTSIDLTNELSRARNADEFTFVSSIDQTVLSVVNDNNSTIRTNSDKPSVTDTEISSLNTVRDTSAGNQISGIFSMLSDSTPREMSASATFSNLSNRHYSSDTRQTFFSYLRNALRRVSEKRSKNRYLINN